MPSHRKNLQELCTANNKINHKQCCLEPLGYHDVENAYYQAFNTLVGRFELQPQLTPEYQSLEVPLSLWIPQQSSCYTWVAIAKSPRISFSCNMNFLCSHHLTTFIYIHVLCRYFNMLYFISVLHFCTSFLYCVVLPTLTLITIQIKHYIPTIESWIYFVV